MRGAPPAQHRPGQPGRGWVPHGSRGPWVFRMLCGVRAGVLGASRASGMPHGDSGESAVSCALVFQE